MRCSLWISLLPCLLWASAAAQCYVPDVLQVGSEPELAADICAIGEALGQSPPDFVTARAIYEAGRDAKSPSLFTVATGGYDTRLWKTFATYFGNQTWLDFHISSAFDGVQPFASDVARVQTIKKILQGGVLVQRVAYHLEEAIKMAARASKIKGKNKSTELRKNALISLDKAMAAYYGTDVDCAVFGNGQSRGIEFGTMLKGVSLTNTKIGKQFARGAKILKGSIKISKLMKVETEIFRNIYIIYIQSVLKYASLIDSAIAKGEAFEKAQAEGFAYAHAVLPVLNEIDPRIATAVFSTFLVSSPGNAEEAKKVPGVLKGAFKQLRIKTSEVKSFDDSRKSNFKQAKVIRCFAVNPFGNVKVGDTDADR